jgi:uncharacterized membrane protein
MLEMRSLVAVLLLATAACQPSGPPVIGGIDLAQPAQALGTEPFWGVEIRPDLLILTGVDREELRVANPGARMEGGAAVFAAEGMTLTLKAAACSDGMSDRTYPALGSKCTKHLPGAGATFGP